MHFTRLALLDSYENTFVVYNPLKNLDLWGLRQPLGIALGRRPSHAYQENPRTPAPPIHGGTIVHVRTAMTGARP